MNDFRLIAALAVALFFRTAAYAADDASTDTAGSAAGPRAAAAAAVAAPPLPPLPPALTFDADFPGGIRLAEFARVVLQDVLRVPFLFSADFLSSSAQVGFSAAQLKKSGSEQLLRDVLYEHGFGLERKVGYYRVAKLKDDDKPDQREDFFYRPKHRDLGYLSSILQPLFSSGQFTYQRQLNAPQQQQGPLSSLAVSSGSTAGKPVDTGGSLYSMSSRSDTDAFVFRAMPRDIARLSALLEKLDVPVSRVLVRALVLEVASRESTGYSVSFVASLLSGKLGLKLAGDVLSHALTFRNASFEAVASAFAGDSTVRVLTAPSVFAETGANASLSVGNSVPTLGAIQYQGNGNSQQSVQYQDTGVILRVTPRVLDDSISLQLEQEISDAVATQTGVNTSPTLTKRRLSSAFNLRSGDWVLLGGLTAAKDIESDSSFPFFRALKFSSSGEKSQSDIVVLLYVERV